MSLIQGIREDGRISKIISGYLTKDPKVFDKVVLFSVCNDKGEFMDCKAWSNDSAGRIAADLKKHDDVIAMGNFETYTNRNGEKQDQLVVNGLVPMKAILALLSASAQPDETDTAAAGSWSDMDDGEGELPF